MPNIQQGFSTLANSLFRNRQLKLQQATQSRLREAQKVALAPARAERLSETLRQIEFGLQQGIKTLSESLPESTPSKDVRPTPDELAIGADTGETLTRKRRLAALIQPFAERVERRANEANRQEKFDRHYSAFREQMLDGKAQGIYDPKFANLPEKMSPAEMRDTLRQIQSARARLKQPEEALTPQQQQQQQKYQQAREENFAGKMTGMSRALYNAGDNYDAIVSGPLRKLLVAGQSSQGEQPALLTTERAEKLWEIAQDPKRLPELNAMLQAQPDIAGLSASDVLEDKKIAARVATNTKITSDKVPDNARMKPEEWRKADIELRAEELDKIKARPGVKVFTGDLSKATGKTMSDAQTLAFKAPEAIKIFDAILEMDDNVHGWIAAVRAGAFDLYEPVLDLVGINTPTGEEDLSTNRQLMIGLGITAAASILYSQSGKQLSDHEKNWNLLALGDPTKYGKTRYRTAIKVARWVAAGRLDRAREIMADGGFDTSQTVSSIPDQIRGFEIRLEYAPGAVLKQMVRDEAAVFAEKHNLKMR